MSALEGAFTARDAVSVSLGNPTYAATVARLGYTDQEIAEVSDRLVDDVIGYGDPDAIAAKVRAHLAAGADHVELMLPSGDFALGLSQYEQLAPSLTTIG